jgi:hypothetical protein
MGWWLSALVVAFGGNAPGELSPLVSDPVVRWSFGPLAFESEPALVFTKEGLRIVANGRDATGRRALVVLDGDDGRLLSRTLLAAKAPLEVRAAGERVAVRGAPHRVDLYRLRGARLLVERSFTDPVSVSAPSLDEREATLREGDALAHYALDQREPLWRARVPGTFRGTPTTTGEHVFAVWYDANETAHLVWLERASGAVHADLPLGRHRAKPDPEAPLVVAHEHVLFVHLVPGLPATSGQDLEWARVPFEGERLGAATLHAFQAAPLETERGWVAPEREADGGTRWLFAQRENKPGTSELVIELASSAHHAWLAANSVAASRAEDVLYLGPCAADARTQSVLWRRERAPDHPAVPVPGGLLVIEGDRLHRLGAGALPRDAAKARARELAGAEDARLGERLLQIASRALRGGEGELARELVPEAEGLGAQGRTLELVRAEVERAAAAPTPAPGSKRRSTLAQEAESARQAWFEDLALAAERAEKPLQRSLLRELFQRDPADQNGQRLLARLVPPGIALAPADTLSWLDWLAFAERQPLALIDDVASDERPSAEQSALAEERARWRADALGHQSARLFVITAGTAPGTVARTLQAGELVCDLLEETFGARPTSAPRLTLVLYPTREEYLAHSGSDLGGLENVLGFTAGHFDLGARVSRLFQPPGDGGAARLLDVSVHELTHHWLALRSPFGELRAAPEQPGFWIVEAIATWAEELRLDLASETWTSDPRRSASLDTLVHAGERDLLRWHDVLVASFADFQKLETRPTCQLSLDGQLGSRAPRSPMQFFYAQGGALAHFLYEGAGPEGRALLLRAVEGYYRAAPLDVARELGVTHEELGKRVLAWGMTQFGG